MGFRCGDQKRAPQKFKGALPRPGAGVNVELVKDKIVDATAKEYLPYVKLIAMKMMKRLPPSIPLDDLIQWGSLGLMDAINKWDPTKENQFKTYAEFRIRGAILDGLRDCDHTPRSVRDLEKLLDRVKLECEQEGKPASREQMAQKLGVTKEKVDEMEVRTQPIVILSVEKSDGDDFTPADRRALLESIQNRGDDLEAKIAAMQKLERICAGHPPISKAVFRLYYVWGLNLKEISECFGQTESRMSQRLKKVRAGIRDDDT
jgi:RNA polymerase sigma factor for flagellar operon FliA